MTCARSGNEVTITHTKTSSVANTAWVVSFTSITNPGSSKPTSSFEIFAQDNMGGSTYYNIDGVTSGLTYTATTLGELTNVSVIRDAGTNDAKRKVNKATSFTFQFDIANDLVIYYGCQQLFRPTPQTLWSFFLQRAMQNL